MRFELRFAPVMACEKSCSVPPATPAVAAPPVTTAPVNGLNAPEVPRRAFIKLEAM